MAGESEIVEVGNDAIRTEQRAKAAADRVAERRKSPKMTRYWHPDANSWLIEGVFQQDTTDHAGGRTSEYEAKNSTQLD